jgi:hypothetical protein
MGIDEQHWVLLTSASSITLGDNAKNTSEKIIKHLPIS